MTAPTPSPEIGVGARVADMKDRIIGGLHGFGAGLEARRARRAAETIQNAEHDVIFYQSLGHIAVGVIEDDFSGLDAFPAPDPNSLRNRGALGRTTESQRRMRTGDTGWPDYPDEAGGIVAPLDHLIDPATGDEVRPRSRRQRRHETKLADQVHEVRDTRKTQQRRAKIHGRSAQYRAIPSKIVSIRAERQIEEDYKSGSINAFERDRKLRLLESDVVESPLTGGLISTRRYKRPHPIHKSERRLEKVTKKMEKRQEKREKAARRDAVKAQRKLVKAQHRGASGRTRQQARRDAIDTRHTP